MRRVGLLAGVLCLLAGFLAPAGATGTQHYVIGTGADDGYQRFGFNVDATSTVMILNRSATPSERQSPMFRFENIQLAQGETVSSATVTVYNDFGQFVDATWQAQAGGCSDLQVNADIYGRSVLGSQIGWHSTGLSRGLVTSPNLSTLLNALTAQATWHKGDSACLILRADETGSQRGFDPRAFESGFPATLDLG